MLVFIFVDFLNLKKRGQLLSTHPHFIYDGLE